MLERLDVLIAFVTVLLGVSLLITILNQMVAGLFGYRATYLTDGIKDLLTTLDPNLKQHVEAIVNDVLTHELASDSVFAHQRWAPRRWRQATAVRPEELSKLLALVSRGKEYAASIDSILAQVNPTLEREARLLQKLAPNATAKAEEVISGLASSATRAIGRLEAGFSSTMDRVRQRFTLQMRIWTVVFSVIFAFVYHMDAKKIYSQLSTDPALRAGLSNASDDLLKKYNEVMASPSDSNAGKQQGAETAQEQKNTESGAAAQPTENDLKERAAKLSQGYKDVRSQLSDFNLAIFPAPGPWYHWKRSEIFGILVMAALLSLGAPFWYNVLKNLVNLRSQVAQKQQQEEEAAS